MARLRSRLKLVKLSNFKEKAKKILWVSREREYVMSKKKKITSDFLTTILYGIKMG